VTQLYSLAEHVVRDATNANNEDDDDYIHRCAIITSSVM